MLQYNIVFYLHFILSTEWLYTIVYNPKLETYKTKVV